MSFLAPLFLIGAAAVALPVLFHLVRRTTRERVRFSSLLFLRPEPPRLTRRNRIEHWLLLALRCLVLVLLALGFARPFLPDVLQQPPGTGTVRRTVLLLDTSASLRRDGLWEQALDRVGARLRSAGPGDHVAVLTFDREVTARMTFEEWDATAAGDRAAQARARLAGLKPGWGGTHLDTALIRAAELFEDPGAGAAPGLQEIVVVSDLQDGAQTAALQAFEWPRGVGVRLERVGPAATSNAGLEWLPAAETAAATSTSVRLRVTNAADAQREQFRVGWAGAEGGWLAPPVEVYVPPGESRVANLAFPTNAAPREARLAGDDEPFDNAVFLLPPEPARLGVLYVGNDAAGDVRASRYFLERALRAAPGREVRVIDAAAAAATVAGAGASPDFAVVVRPPQPAEAAVLQALLARGRTVLFAPPDAAAVGTLAGWAGRAAPVAGDHQPASYALLGEVDFQHPLFLPFADPRFNNFTGIRFWRHRRLDLSAVPDARVIARFDSGDAALVELPAGPGRVMLLASGWHPAESQLALSSKFVPLVQGLLELSAGLLPVPAQHRVGEPVVLASTTSAAPGAVTVRLPDGATAEVPAGHGRFTATGFPGVYGAGPDVAPAGFVVNLAPSESRTAPMPLDALERLGVPVSGAVPTPEQAAARQERLQRAELESRQKLWRWFLAATLAVLLVETVLAGWSARRAAPGQEVVA